jgi:hypothetical protein
MNSTLANKNYHFQTIFELISKVTKPINMDKS